MRSCIGTQRIHCWIKSITAEINLALDIFGRAAENEIGDIFELVEGIEIFDKYASSQLSKKDAEEWKKSEMVCKNSFHPLTFWIKIRINEGYPWWPRNRCLPGCILQTFWHPDVEWWNCDIGFRKEGKISLKVRIRFGGAAEEFSIIHHWQSINTGIIDNKLFEA